MSGRSFAGRHANTVVCDYYENALRIGEDFDADV
jgi:hypothetical protein